MLYFQYQCCEKGNIIIIFGLSFEKISIYVLHANLVEKECKGFFGQSFYIFVDVQGAKYALFHDKDSRGILWIDPSILQLLHLGGDSLFP